MTATGHPRAVFKRAIARGNLAVAEAMVREIGRASLEETLELTALIAVKERHRYERVAARWLRLYLDERAVSLDDVVFVVACLKQLGGPHHLAALGVLRAAAA